jgi:Tfp pilus assembly protein PilF
MSRQRKLLSAVLTSFFAIPFASMAAGNSQDQRWLLQNGAACRQIVLTITGTDSRPIPFARVRVDQDMTEPADLQGRVLIDNLSPGNRFALEVAVSARGYHSEIRLLEPTACAAEITLKPDRSLLYGPSVSANELLPDARKKASDLREEAVKELRKGNYVSAERLLLGAFDLTPSSDEICNNLGVTFSRLGDLDQASHWFEKAAELAPYNPLIALNLGMIRWQQQRLDESYQLLKSAAAQGYTSQRSRFILGLLELGQGRPAEAARRLSEVSPKSFPYRDLYLSIALAREGKRSAASKRFSDFRRRNPVQPVVLTIGPATSSPVASAGRSPR